MFENGKAVHVGQSKVKRHSRMAIGQQPDCLFTARHRRYLEARLLQILLVEERQRRAVLDKQDPAQFLRVASRPG